MAGGGLEMHQIGEDNKQQTVTYGLYEHEVVATRHEFRHRRRGGLIVPRRSEEKPECSSLC